MDLLDDSVSGVFVALDDDRHVRGLREQGLDLADYALNADAFTAIEDFVVSSDSEENRIFFKSRSPATDIGLVDGDTCFLDENGGDDEENEEDENTIDHRGKVDNDWFIVFLHGAAEHNLGRKKELGIFFGEAGGKNECLQSGKGSGDDVAFVFNDQTDE